MKPAPQLDLRWVEYIYADVKGELQTWQNMMLILAGDSNFDLTKKTSHKNWAR
ncbi:hypothetical protein MIM_c25540 [Advenella mimigardefordensis DPN7]|uniref:Uncharacterized protein n=1 Tax=Advenella mimigardefordensis (strain DSM 17166 / LMG 22922 / DPN7) TaxID=1247726 RepID=W0PCK3_ADVMD|nr:hypothetical protein MIM_c25540 [Advenella mimigardefordensis DPN7]